MADNKHADGRAIIESTDPIPALARGQWTLTFRPDVEALAPGAAVRISVPPGFSQPQVENCAAPGFVQVSCDDSAVAVQVAVDGSANDRFDVQTGRDVDPGVILYIERSPLKPGSALHVIYGAGEAGAYASPFSGSAVFGVYVCSDGRSFPERFFPVAAPPALPVQSGPPAELEVTAPSGAEPGTDLTLRALLRDAYGNRCEGWSGWFSIESETPGLTAPASQRQEDPTGSGVNLAVGLPEDLAEGVLRIKVKEAETGLEAVSNPVLVGQVAPFWGDIHACIPDPDMHQSVLDFELAVGQAPSPGKVSFHFHASDEVDGGDGDPGPLNLSLPDAGSDEMLPAHLLEVYSCWGNREYWGARYADMDPARHPDRTVHAVLSQGIIAGFGAGSNSRVGVGTDARRAEPGRGYKGGLTGVFVTSLTRASLFGALRERNCYATTGPRIVLRMEVSGHGMGQRVEVGAADRETMAERHVTVTAHGTDRVDRIEIVRNNGEVCTYRGDSADVTFAWTDRQDLGSISLPRAMGGGALTCYYFARVIQDDGEIAWTSPVWFVLR